MWLFSFACSFMLSIPRQDTTMLEEHFVDSLHIGRKHHNKVEISQFSKSDSIYVIIRFYARAGARWSLKQEIRFRKAGDIDCDPKISDFNHDGYNDLTCVSLQAARGANEVRRLYIYNKEEDRLVYMRNSEHYPNMQYNPYLNCIDAWLVYGGCSTVFLRVRGDRLQEFASVEIYDGLLTVSDNDRYGKEKVIRRMKIEKGDMTRFRSYKPLIPY